MLLEAAAGSVKLDSICSLDLMSLTNSYSFATKMKTDSVALLEGLEAWVDKQAHSMDMAQNLEKLSQNFDSLLKVMDSLYQVHLHVLVWNAFAHQSCAPFEAQNMGTSAAA